MISLSKKKEASVMKAKIRLDTLTDIRSFVDAVSSVAADVHLSDGQGLKVSGKSLLGAAYTMEWHDVYVECDFDIYSKISQFVVND